MGLAVLVRAANVALNVTLGNQDFICAAAVCRCSFVGVINRVHMAQGCVTPNNAGRSPAFKLSLRTVGPRTGDGRGWLPILGNVCFVVWR